MRKIFLLIVSLVVTDLLQTQQVGEIITDRPDQTESSFTVEPGFLQIETGAVFETSRRRITTLSEPPLIVEANEHVLYIPAALIRYGVTNYVELRFGEGL